MNTKDMINEFGDGESFIYDGWFGFAGNIIDEWYSAELTNEAGGSLNGEHRSTSEEAENDIHLLKVEYADSNYTSARVVKHSPALRISIAKEIEL